MSRQTDDFDNPYRAPQAGGQVSKSPVVAQRLAVEGGVTYEFELSLDDMVVFGVYHSLHSTEGRRRRMVLWFIVPLMLVLLGLLVTISGVWPVAIGSGLLLFFTIFAVLWMIFFPALYRQSLNKGYQRLWSSSDNAGMFGIYRVTATHQGLSCESPEGFARRLWSGVKRVVVTDANALLYYSSFTAVVIPKRAFDSQQDLDKFLEVIEQYRQAATGGAA